MLEDKGIEVPFQFFERNILYTGFVFEESGRWLRHLR